VRSVFCTPDAAADLVCSDLYGNAGGDWTGCIADQLGEDGNFSEDPLFCGPDGSDLTVAAVSPCASEGNPCGALVGAWPVGCALPSGLEAVPVSLVGLYLGPAVPNPTSGRTVIYYRIPQDGSPAKVTLELFDVRGRRVFKVADGIHTPGSHRVV
jgi:hypothetical protein